MAAWLFAGAATAVAAGALVALGLAVARARALRLALARCQESAREAHQIAAGVRFTADSIEILDTEGRILYVNPAYEASQGVVLADVLGRRPEDVESVLVQDGAYYDMLRVSGEEGRVWTGVLQSRLRTGKLLEEQVTVSPIRDDADAIAAYVIVKRDVATTRRLEQRLAQAERLEAIGRLAAGIAHEVNTPMQFVGDNLRFIRDSVAELLPLLRNLAGPAGRAQAAAAGLETALTRVDIDFLAADLPLAIEQSLEGCDRITRIVKAMKAFSHPCTDRVPADLNKAIESTVTVATHAWKAVASVRLDLDPGLPEVVCNAGEINQAVLNIIVNAAHAIEGAGAARTGSGLITLKTRAVTGGVCLTIADNGIGMPPEVRDRVFDPFFTTKPVGRGTGQGLAIAHDVVVRRHGGRLEVESTVGQGTTFNLWLPAQPAATPATGIAA